MPGAARRMYPARTNSLWLGTSASAGSSRRVRRNRDDIRNNTVTLPWSRIQATGAPRPPAVAYPPVPARGLPLRPVIRGHDRHLVHRLSRSPWAASTTTRMGGNVGVLAGDHLGGDDGSQLLP